MAGDQRFFNWVLIAKGIGIMLVVIGHFHSPDSPGYWDDIRRLIYSFHMPLFFMLSGFLYSHAKYSYPELVTSKIKRLGYPFISIAALFFIIKYLAGKLFYLEHPVGMEGIYALLINPVNSYMPLLWFVHALFLIFLIYPPLRTIAGNNLSILFLIILINILIGNRYPVIGNALANMPFFVIGVILRENGAARQTLVSGRWSTVAASMTLFILTYMLIQKMYAGHQAGYLMVLAAGVTGAICTMNISSLIDTSGGSIGKVILVGTGTYSMTIYLFHTLFESAVGIGFRQLPDSLRPDFWVVAAAAIIAGVLFPLLLERFFLRKYAVTRKYLLGLQ